MLIGVVTLYWLVCENTIYFHVDIQHFLPSHTILQPFYQTTFWNQPNALVFFLYLKLQKESRRQEKILSTVDFVTHSLGIVFIFPIHLKVVLYNQWNCNFLIYAMSYFCPACITKAFYRSILTVKCLANNVVFPYSVLPSNIDFSFSCSGNIFSPKDKRGPFPTSY